MPPTSVLSARARCPRLDAVRALAGAAGRAANKPAPPQQQAQSKPLGAMSARTVDDGRPRVTAAAGAALNNTASPAAARAGASATPVPLKLVVQEAVKRWFEDTLAEAQRGDVKQQALLGQMLAEGYGCERDPQAAREWSERASQRGFRMRGVYCSL